MIELPCKLVLSERTLSFPDHTAPNCIVNEHTKNLQRPCKSFNKKILYTSSVLWMQTSFKLRLETKHWSDLQVLLTSIISSYMTHWWLLGVKEKGGTPPANQPDVAGFGSTRNCRQLLYHLSLSDGRFVLCPYLLRGISCCC